MISTAQSTKPRNVVFLFFGIKSKIAAHAIDPGMHDGFVNTKSEKNTSKYMTRCFWESDFFTSRSMVTLFYYLEVLKYKSIKWT